MNKDIRVWFENLGDKICIHSRYPLQAVSKDEATVIMQQLEEIIKELDVKETIKSKGE